MQNNRNSNRTQMAAEIKTTAAMPPLTAITGLTHNGRSARYGIKPAHVNFRLANTENVCSSVARARLLFLLGPAPSAPSRTQRSRVSARPCPPCNRPWTCHHTADARWTSGCARANTRANTRAKYAHKYTLMRCWSLCVTYFCHVTRGSR